MTVARSGARGVSPADAVRLYRDQPLSCRSYIGVRRLLLPLAAIERHLPERGRILDVGCGFGLLANFVALRSPGRTVWGIDLAAERIDVARQASAALPNVRFESADIRSLDARSFDAVMLIDVLHYFPPSTQAEIVAACRRALVPAGNLICRDAVRERGPRFWWNWLHEALMVRSGLTTTPDRRLHFLRFPEIKGLIEQAGFTVVTVQRLRRYLPYTDTLLVARAAHHETAGSRAG